MQARNASNTGPPEGRVFTREQAARLRADE